MSNINKRLNSLKPYVTGIRFHENIQIVDTILKEGWVIPKSEFILKAEDEKDKTIFMFFSQDENIGIDEILDYIETIVNINLEREKKQILFKEKIEELREFFKKHKLNELINMKFSLIENDPIHKELDNDIHEENTSIEIKETKQPNVIESKEQLKEVFKEKPVFTENMTEEEREEEESIARAEAFRKQKLEKQNNPQVKTHNKVELPPKSNNTTIMEQTCDCGDGLDKFCDYCMERKGL